MGMVKHKDISGVPPGSISRLVGKNPTYSALVKA